MKKYEHLKLKAQEMRKSGKTIGDICLHLALGKGTVHYWIKGIPREIGVNGRTDAQKSSQRIGTKATQKKYADLRFKSYELGSSEYDGLIARDTFRDFVVLYLTEGFRRTRNQVAVANSNPNLVKLAYRWIKTLMNADRSIDFQLQCHVDNDESELKRFWAKELGIVEDHIKVIRKSNSGELSGRQWRSVHGVFTVRANDTYLRSRIEAWMDRIQEEWNRA